MSTYKTILVEEINNVGLIKFNRPETYNSLNPEMMDEIISALQFFDTTQHIGCMVLTGTQKSFAAGADITEMSTASTEEMEQSTFIPTFDKISLINKPLIAAVSGYCLGGGMELALACDLITASENARFGLPEITLGVIPGAGGTQRLPRLIGKQLSMEIILNNRLLESQEAYQFGLINHLYSVDSYLEQTIALAQLIAERAPLAVIAAKEMINMSFEKPLHQGLEKEREKFYQLFSTDDQKEGMEAFLEKRNPDWIGE
jgi:enoyl-CoA hydratase